MSVSVGPSPSKSPLACVTFNAVPGTASAVHGPVGAGEADSVDDDDDVAGADALEPPDRDPDAEATPGFFESLLQPAAAHTSATLTSTTAALRAALTATSGTRRPTRNSDRSRDPTARRCCAPGPTAAATAAEAVAPPPSGAGHRRRGAQRSRTRPDVPLTQWPRRRCRRPCRPAVDGPSTATR